MSLAVVQVRSHINTSREIRDTLDMLNLGGRHNLTVVPEEPSYTGMVRKINDIAAYGEPSASALSVVLSRRAETLDGEELTPDYIEGNTEYSGFDELAEALIDGETTLRDAGVRPQIRLHPPRGGFSDTKKTYSRGGVLGDHGDDIDELLLSMK